MKSKQKRMVSEHVAQRNFDFAPAELPSRQSFANYTPKTLMTGHNKSQQRDGPNQQVSNMQFSSEGQSSQEQKLPFSENRLRVANIGNIGLNMPSSRQESERRESTHHPTTAQSIQNYPSHLRQAAFMESRNSQKRTIGDASNFAMRAPNELSLHG